MAKLNHPTDLRYSRSDEWVRTEGDLVYVGISDYAQDQLGNIVSLELPWDEAGQAIVRLDRPFGNIDSVKASSELVSPLTGTVVKINERLQNEPEVINDDPYGEGWILAVRPDHPEELEQLLTGAQYIAYLSERTH